MEISSQFHATAMLPSGKECQHFLDKGMKNRLGLNVVKIVEISCPCRKSNHCFFVVYPCIINYTVLKLFSSNYM
jgi:hypothetical protein